MKPNKPDLAKMLKILSDYYNTPLEGTIVASYRLALEDFDANWGAVTKIILQRFTRMPKAAEIINLVLPSLGESLSAKQHGIDLISEIQDAIYKYGWNNEAEAKKVLSQRSQLVVRQLGGWQKVCSSDFSNPGFYAQARDLAETITEKENFIEDVEMLSIAGAIVKNIKVKDNSENELNRKKLEALKKLKLVIDEEENKPLLSKVNL